MKQRGMRGLGCVMVAAIVLGLTGCSGKPSERACQRVVENAIAKDGYCRIKNFKKVNAVSGSMFGQETYTVQCTWDEEYLKDKPEDRSSIIIVPGRKKGDVIHTPDGNLIFRKTEKGWLGMDGNIY